MKSLSLKGCVSSRHCVVILAVISVFSALRTEARIDDTKAEAEKRFKTYDAVYQKDKYGFEFSSYATSGFSIKQYYLEGTCVKSSYYKKYIAGAPHEFMMPEIQKIAEIEASGEWKVVVPPGEESGSVYASFVNSQGTTLEISGNKRMITVETKAYRDAVERFGQK